MKKRRAHAKVSKTGSRLNRVPRAAAALRGGDRRDAAGLRDAASAELGVVATVERSVDRNVAVRLCAVGATGN